MVPNETASWTVTAAKAHFAQVIARALTDGPQNITRRGRAAGVVVSAEEWERKTKRKGTLADFLAASPLRGSGLDLARERSEPRDLEL
jgi:prevent-host-death family protein